MHRPIGNMSRLAAAFLSFSAVGCLIFQTAATPPAFAAEASGKKIDDSLAHGAHWLAGQQNADGGYGQLRNSKEKGLSDVGLSAFTLFALAAAGKKESDGPQVAKAAEFLLGMQQADGSFYDPREPSLQNYKTSVCVLALVTLDRAKFGPQVAKAIQYLKTMQFSEDRGTSKDDLNYGAMGYGGNNSHGDLSNTNFTLEALHEAGISGADNVYERVQVFLSRCQNSPAVDEALKKAKIGTTKDGGFRYGTNATRGPEETLDDGTRVYSSYGSMTYAGLKSLLYANVKKDDPRVQAAFNWIAKNFTVTENPGRANAKNPAMGQEGLYYYYYTMAKALMVYGEPTLTDAKGARHDWAAELSEQLAKIQQPAGSWVSASKRWGEDNPVLATSYSLVALSNCKKELERRGAEGKKPDKDK